MRRSATRSSPGSRIPYHSGSRLISIGSRAPIFEAWSTEGVISLIDYRGRKHVVLAFYPQDFSAICTAQMQSFQRDLSKFQDLGAEIIGVSPDNLERHHRFSRENNLQFPLISDVKGDVTGLFSTDRMTYLIDREGIVRFIQKGVADTKILINELATLNCLGRA